MVHVIVERVFAEPADVAALSQRFEEAKSCFVMRNVQHVRTCLARDGRRMICEYTAPDAESVRVANQLAGLPFERAWSAEVMESPKPSV